VLIIFIEPNNEKEISYTEKIVIIFANLFWISIIWSNNLWNNRYSFFNEGCFRRVGNKRRK
jgi:hypothetical protein